MSNGHGKGRFPFHSVVFFEIVLRECCISARALLTRLDLKRLIRICTMLATAHVIHPVNMLLGTDPLETVLWNIFREGFAHDGYLKSP